MTDLIQAWGRGDERAIDQLVPLIYQELHRLAARYMRREYAGHTLQTTALVNEAYCKLIDQKNVQWQNRAQFFAIAAQLMRRILVDHARKRLRLKRGGAARKITFDEAAFIPQSDEADLLALDDALTSLAEFDPKKSRIVEMKFFAGLNMDEIAEVEQVSKSTIEREWRKAKAWLHHEIQRQKNS